MNSIQFELNSILCFSKPGDKPGTETANPPSGKGKTIFKGKALSLFWKENKPFFILKAKGIKGKIPPLPGAEKEAKLIAELFANFKSSVTFCCELTRLCIVVGLKLFPRLV